MKKFRFLSVALVFIMICSVAGCKGNDGESYEFIEVWHYYNGAQKDVFDSLVKRFNDTEGQREGIVVHAMAKGKVNELGQAILDSANKKVGSEPMPQLFMSYSDIAFEVDKLGMLSDIGQYFSSRELEEYYAPFLEEGKISGNQIKIFPTAKSTEVFMMNKTDWDKFEAKYNAAHPSDTVSVQDLATYEGILRVGKKYYETEGKPFFAIDAIANYLLIGAKQLGVDVFEVNTDKTVTYNLPENQFRQLWDAYYTPYMEGYFNCNDNYFGTADIRIGNLLACVGSSSSCAFFPDKVKPTDDEKDDYSIETLILPAPLFEDGAAVQVQQGAGMCLGKSDTETEKAAAKFIKWVTDTNQNLEFCLKTGYIPVKKQAQNIDKVNEFVQNADFDINMLNIEMMKVSFEILKSRTFYYSKPFDEGVQARAILDKFKAKIKADKLKVTEIKDETEKAEKILALTGKASFDQWLSQLKNSLINL